MILLSYPGLGLVLLIIFFPHLCILLLHALWGLALQGAFWANPSQKRKLPLLGFVLLDFTCGGTGSAFPILRGEGGRRSRWTEQQGKGGFFSADGAKRMKLCKPPESTGETEIK